MSSEIQPVAEYASIARILDDHRSLDELREQYLLEVRLADRLRDSNPDERTRLYTELYDELFRSLPHHPQNARRQSDQKDYIDRQLPIILRYLEPGQVFVEIGGGDCKLSWAVAETASKVYALEITHELYDAAHAPANVRLVITEGIELPLEDESADLVFSNQLMEHLHPDDALVQLRSIFRVLKPGGRYVCITPSAISGPHDISRYFDRVARGFHLKEYDYASMAAALRAAGFRRVDALLALRGRVLGTIGIDVAIRFERALLGLPEARRRVFGRSMVGRGLLGLKVVASKV
jgi:SAM-dependent methyltransferase